MLCTGVAIGRARPPAARGSGPVASKRPGRAAERQSRCAGWLLGSVYSRRSVRAGKQVHFFSLTGEDRSQSVLLTGQPKSSLKRATRVGRTPSGDPRLVRTHRCGRTASVESSGARAEAERSSLAVGGRLVTACRAGGARLRAATGRFATRPYGQSAPLGTTGSLQGEEGVHVPRRGVEPKNTRAPIQEESVKAKAENTTGSAALEEGDRQKRA